MFSKQLKIFANPGDVLVLFSCSGTSRNIVNAAKTMGEVIKVFGGEGTYEDIENRHLIIAHRVATSLGPKNI